jgi:hypothetical protein
MTTILATAVDPRYPVTSHYSRILKNIRGSEKGTRTNNYATKKDELLKKHHETRQQKEVIPLTSEQIEARRASARSHYTNLKPERRQTICDRQRLLYANMTAEKKMQREIVKSTLCDTTKYSK